MWHYQRAVSLRNEGQAFYQRRRNHSWLSKKSQIFLFPALQGNLLRVLVDSPDVPEEKSPREVEILKSKKATDPDKELLLLASQNNRTLKVPSLLASLNNRILKELPLHASQNNRILKEPPLHASQNNGILKEPPLLASLNNKILRMRMTRGSQWQSQSLHITRGILGPTLFTHGCIRRSIQKCGRHGGRNSLGADEGRETQLRRMKGRW